MGNVHFGTDSHSTQVDNDEISWLEKAHILWQECARSINVEDDEEPVE